MKTKSKLTMNKISVAIIFLCLITFAAHFLYTTDLKRRQKQYHSEFSKFILSLVDERIEALEGTDTAVSREIILSVSDNFAIKDLAQLVVFETGTGRIIYPSKTTESHIEDEIMGKIGAGIEGELESDGRFGYFVNYKKLDATFFIYTSREDLYFYRNQLLYILMSLFFLFSLFIFLIDRRIWSLLKSLMKEIITCFDRSFLSRDRPLEKLELESGEEIDKLLTGYNKMVYRAGNFIQKLEDRIGSLVKQRDDLKKMVFLYRKYLPSKTLQKLSEQNISDSVSKRQKVSALSMEILNFLKPIDEVYPQVITDELNKLNSVIKDEAARSGGIVNFSHGYFLNVVYGVPAADSNSLLRAVESSKRVLHWIQERNNSSRNISGIRWEVKMGLSFGPAVNGIVGDNFLVLGKVVERSMLMLDYAKYYKVPLVTDSIYEIKAVKDIKYRKLDNITKNHEPSDSVYEIFLEYPEKLDDAIKLFDHGLDMFFDGKYDMAVYEFKKVHRILEGDNPSLIFLERCEKRIKR
jgi:hypothetical protein